MKKLSLILVLGFVFGTLLTGCTKPADQTVPAETPAVSTNVPAAK